MEAATGARQSAPTVAPARWQLRVLGELRLAQGAQQVERFPSRAVAALLVRLALWPDRAHAREELVELLWPGIDLAVGRNRLRQALSTLRALVEPPGAPQVLQADRLAVRLVPGAVDCDALQFEAELRAGRPGLALALYRGELLPGHYDSWIADERLRLEALAERAAQASGGRAGAAVAPAPAPVAVLPHAAAATAPGPGAALPSYLTRYFETGAQVGALGERLREHRLVTLTGPGGSGKTRLAVELARTLQARGGFDLVAFIPLVACNDAADLPERLLGALQPGQAGGLEAVVRTLAGRHALLVLDNLEQVLPAAAEAVSSLLAALPHLHVLATSRRRLDVDGELEWSVQPLPVPEADAALEDLAASPALALFVDRARAARADFHLGPRNAAALAALVRALEGMPLAIELAASRVRSFSPAEMAERLGRRAEGSTPRLDLLERQGPRAGFDARHASMNRTIAWSWGQLAPADAQLLAALTLFDGGFTAAAASALVDDEDVALRLDGLRAHSLLSSREQADGTLRFALYEPIREFAAQHLAAAQAAAGRRRLRAWWLAWAQGLPATPPLARLRAELPNLTAAVAGAVADGVPHEALHLALALRGVLADVGAPAALLQALEDALSGAAGQGDVLGDEGGLRSGVHSLLGALLFAAGQRERALDQVAQGLALAPAAGPARARALHSAASVRWRAAASPAELAPLIAEGLAHAGADTQVRASLVALQAYIANQAERDYARGEALHREALALWSASGNRLAIHAGRYNLAMCAFNARRWAEARALVEDVVASTEADEDWRQQCRALNLLGLVLAEQRDWAGALGAYRRCVDLAWRTVWPHMLAYGLWNAPRALAHLRRPREAAGLMSFASAHWQAHFGALGAADRHDLRRVQRLASAAAGGPAARGAWAEGAGWTLADAVALVRRAG